MTLAQLIGDLRNFISEHPSLTKTEIAERVGVKLPGLCNLLSGVNKPTGEQVLKIQELTSEKSNGLNAVNSAALKRLKNSGAHIINFQSHRK